MELVREYSQSIKKRYGNLEARSNIDLLLGVC